MSLKWPLISLQIMWQLHKWGCVQARSLLSFRHTQDKQICVLWGVSQLSVCCFHLNGPIKASLLPHKWFEINELFSGMRTSKCNLCFHMHICICATNEIYVWTYCTVPCFYFINSFAWWNFEGQPWKLFHFNELYVHSRLCSGLVRGFHLICYSILIRHM